MIQAGKSYVLAYDSAHDVYFCTSTTIHPFLQSVDISITGEKQMCLLDRLLLNASLLVFIPFYSSSFLLLMFFPLIFYYFLLLFIPSSLLIFHLFFIHFILLFSFSLLPPPRDTFLYSFYQKKGHRLKS